MCLLGGVCFVVSMIIVVVVAIVISFPSWSFWWLPLMVVVYHVQRSYAEKKRKTIDGV